MNNNNKSMFNSTTQNRNNAGGFSFMGGTKQDINQYKQTIIELKDRMSQLQGRNEELEKYRKSRMADNRITDNGGSSMRSLMSQLETQLRNLDNNIVSKINVLTNEIQQQSPKDLIMRFLQQLQNCNSNNLSANLNTQLKFESETDLRQVVNVTKSTSYDIKTMKQNSLKIEEYARRIQQNSELLSQNLSSKLEQIFHHLTNQGFKTITEDGMGIYIKETMYKEILILKNGNI
eukprot:UN33133